MQMSHLMILALLAVIFVATGFAAPDDPAWQPFAFLLGSWTGEGTGAPGEGSGGFTFQFDLQGKILVRKNHADYPKTKDRPAYSHEDLMVIYRESPTAPFRADYFDNEGHVIHYTIQVSTNGGTLQFISDADSVAPRYRFTYMSTAKDNVGIKFEITPPGKPEAFSTYIEAKAHRTTAR